MYVPHLFFNTDVYNGILQSYNCSKTVCKNKQEYKLVLLRLVLPLLGVALLLRVVVSLLVSLIDVEVLLRVVLSLLL